MARNRRLGMPRQEHCDRQDSAAEAFQTYKGLAERAIRAGKCYRGLEAMGQAHTAAGKVIAHGQGCAPRQGSSVLRHKLKRLRHMYRRECQRD